MSLSDRVGRFTEKYLFNRVVAGGYPPKNYRVEYESISDNSTQLILTVTRGVMGFFSSGKTLVNEIMADEKGFKADLQKYLEKSLPQYNIYLSDIITMSNQTVIFTISYYPRTELPPDMIRKIMSYLPPEEIERISGLFPGQENLLEDQYLWHMVVMNNFAQYYPFLEQVALGSVQWDELYQELDAFRRLGDLSFDSQMFRVAAIHDFTELVSVMLEDPMIDPNAVNGDTPLIAAVSMGKFAVTKILLDHPRVMVNASALLQAVLDTQNPVMAQLLSRSIEPSLAALALAIYGGDRERFEELLKEVEITDGFNLVMAAVIGNRPEFLRRILESPQVDPSIRNDAPLLIATYNGYTEIVRILLQDPRVNPIVQNNQPFVNAVGRNHTEIVRLLLEDPRVNPSLPGDAPVLIAAKNLNPEILQLLLEDPRVNPLQNFPNILNLAVQTFNESKRTFEDAMKVKATFKVLYADQRIKQAVQQLSFLERQVYNFLETTANM